MGYKIYAALSEDFKITGSTLSGEKTAKMARRTGNGMAAGTTLIGAGAGALGMKGARAVQRRYMAKKGATRRQLEEHRKNDRKYMLAAAGGGALVTGATAGRKIRKFGNKLGDMIQDQSAAYSF